MWKFVKILGKKNLQKNLGGKSPNYERKHAPILGRKTQIMVKNLYSKKKKSKLWEKFVRIP